MTPREELKPVSIGDRTFVPIQEGTLRQDLRYMELVSQLGLQSLYKRPEETAEEYAMRLLGEIVAAGTVLEILGTLLVPAGTDPEKWTPQMAKETAAYFGSLTKPEDKAAVHAQVLTLLLDFFERGMVSLKTSRKSSGAAHPDDRPNADAPIATESGAT